jgi:hypothetical protein
MPDTREAPLRATIGRWAIRIVLGAIGLGVGLLAVSALREATLSTHQPVDPDSTVEVVVRARTHAGEEGQTLAEMVQAQTLMCRLEVTSDLIDQEGKGDGVFELLLTPAMDETNQRQFKGCLEDFAIDGVQIDVLDIREPE